VIGGVQDDDYGDKRRNKSGELVGIKPR